MRPSRYTSSRPAPGTVAYDTSGVEPAANLTLSGAVDLGRRLGHRHARRQGAGHHRLEQEAARPDQGAPASTRSRPGSRPPTWCRRTPTSSAIPAAPRRATSRSARRCTTTTTSTAPTTTDANGAARAVDAVGRRGAAGDAAARRRRPTTRSNGRRIYVNGVLTDARGPDAGGTASPTGTTPSRCVLGNEVSQRPPVAGRRAHGRHPQPRADAGADPAELRRRRRRALLPAVLGHRDLDQRAAELHHVRGQPVRQLLVPVQQADVHQPRSGQPATRSSIHDQGHAHRRQRRRGARSARPMRRST